jgi:hypothetical protein
MIDRAARTIRPATLAVVALLAGCATQPPAPPPSYASYSDRLPCVDRIGRCFDAAIAGQPVVVIADKQRHERITAEAHEGNSDVREVYWEVLEPVDGQHAMDIEVSANALGRPHVGEPEGDVDLTIYPLDDQDLDSKQEMVASPDVRINGHAAVRQQNTLTQDDLPPGRYVISIRYAGTRNWERKSVYLRVK